MNKVTPIKPAPAPPPDCLILNQDTSLVINHTTCYWKAGVPITDAAHIAAIEALDLRHLPRKRYELISEQPSPTPPGEEHDLEVAA